MKQTISGLKHFYNETGVQPYLYLTDTINGSHFPTEQDLEAFATDLYDELFLMKHILLIVFLNMKVSTKAGTSSEHRQKVY